MGINFTFFVNCSFGKWTLGVVVTQPSVSVTQQELDEMNLLHVLLFKTKCTNEIIYWNILSFMFKTLVVPNAKHL